MSKIWIFSNHSTGRYEESDWDTSTILRTKKYYFKEPERNRRHINKGDKILLREYGTGFWGECEISDDWVPDDNGQEKYGIKSGWFGINKIVRWNTVLPYELVASELSNQNFRMRIAKANSEDKNKINFALKIYMNLGYCDTDGDLFLLENGIEEAVKANLSRLNLRLAEKEIQQQCNLGIGVGKTDLICRDKNENFVVLELKANRSSDVVVGQILRYMGYIRENMAEEKKVKGIIITPSYDEQLRLAAKEAGIKVLRVRII